MSLMTPEERARLVPKGLYVKYKCDGCGRAIMTPLSFTGDNGEDYCSRACRDGALSSNKPKERDMKEEKAKKAKRTESDEAEPIKKKKKRRPVEEDPEVVKKAKKSKRAEPEDEEDDDEDEEAPPAKKSKKPSKKSKKGSNEREYKPVVPKGKNPYNKAGSVSHEFFERCKKGATIKELNAYIEEAGVAPARLWREIRSGGIRGMKWRVIEDKKTIKVVLLKSK